MRATIRQAVPADLETVRALFREYETFLGVDLGFQGFEEELANLPGDYAAPEGGLWIGDLDGRPMSCVALRPRGGGRCELKRLFVRPEARGCGLGSALLVTTLDYAQMAGHSTMVLDTLRALAPAVKLYKHYGFVEVPPYYHNPLEGVVYLQLTL